MTPPNGYTSSGHVKPRYRIVGEKLEPVGPAEAAQRVYWKHGPNAPFHKVYNSSENAIVIGGCEFPPGQAVVVESAGLNFTFDQWHELYDCVYLSVAPLDSQMSQMGRPRGSEGGQVPLKRL
jgi:hypothetical protein